MIPQLSSDAYQTFVKEILHVSREAINQASRGEYDQAQDLIEQIYCLDDEHKQAITMLFNQCKEDSCDFNKISQGLSKFLYRNACPRKPEVCYTKWKKLAIQLAEENKKFYSNQTLVKYRNSHVWSKESRANSVINFREFDLEKKMEQKDKNAPPELKRVRKCVNYVLMESVKTLMQNFIAAKIDIDQSSLFSILC